MAVRGLTGRWRVGRLDPLGVRPVGQVSAHSGADWLPVSPRRRPIRLPKAGAGQKAGAAHRKPFCGVAMRVRSGVDTTVRAVSLHGSAETSEPAVDNPPANPIESLSS